MLALALAAAAFVPGAVLLHAGPVGSAAPLPSFLRVVNAASSSSPLDVTVDGAPAGRLSWGGASEWKPLPPGRHLVTTASTTDTDTAEVAVEAACRTTVVLTRPAPTARRVDAVLLTDCGAGRITPGQARISFLLATDTDFGSVRLAAGTVSAAGPPLRPHAGQGIRAGRVQITAGTRAGEIFMSTVADLAPGTSYTVLWIGGGEAPARFAVLADAAQAPAPPAGRINTGIPARGGFPPAGVWILVAAVAVVVASVRSRQLLRAAAATAACGVLAACGPAVQDGLAATPHGSSAAPAPVVPATAAPASPGPRSSGGFAPGRLAVPGLRIDRSLPSVPADRAESLPSALAKNDIAWLDGTSPLGVPGTVALAGHTGFDGTGAFARLGELRPGMALTVTARDGTVFDYVVTGTQVAQKNALPEWLWSPQPVSVLVLVSCTGPAARGLHRDNLIVVAVPR